MHLALGLIFRVDFSYANRVRYNSAWIGSFLKSSIFRKFMFIFASSFITFAFVFYSNVEVQNSWGFFVLFHPYTDKEETHMAIHFHLLTTKPNRPTSTAT
jgi:hypothetical protein